MSGGWPGIRRRPRKARRRTREADKCVQVAETPARFGSLERAFALINRVTGTDDRDAITRRPPHRSTRHEERAGLLDETATIGTRSGWATARIRWDISDR